MNEPADKNTPKDWFENITFELSVSKNVDNYVLDAAKSYIETALLIYGLELKPELKGPFIVNATFAMELYFKSMMAKARYGPEKKLSNTMTKYEWMYSETIFNGNGHNLLNLFSQVPEKFKNEILDKFKKHPEKVDLELFLEEHKKNFVNWRYSFEGKSKPYCPKTVLTVLNILKYYTFRLEQPNAKVFEI